MENTDKVESKREIRRKKLRNFLDYYKWHTVAAAVLIAIMISQIYTNLISEDILLSGVMLNSRVALSGEASISEFTDAFLKELQLDPKKYGLDIMGNLTYFSEYETSPMDTYYSVQALSAQVSAGTLDFVVGNQEAMVALAYGDFYADLSRVLSLEVFAQYAPYLLYMDQAILEQMQATDWSGEETVTVEFPDPRDPAAMGAPIPVLIDVSGSKALSDIYFGVEEPLVFAVAGNAPHPENVEAMLEFLTKTQNLEDTNG